MKYKYIIVISNIIIIFFLLMIVLLPLFSAEPGVGVYIRHITLFFTILLIIILICLNAFFFYNYRLLSLLEREDWPALAYYLEQKIIVKGQYSVQKVRILASSYIVISDYASVFKLENKAMHIKPVVVKKNALIFGSARVLSGNYADAAAFLRPYRGNDEWTRWFCGFSALLSGSFDQVEPDFLFLAASSRDMLITGLSAYFLFKNLSKHSARQKECLSAAENGCSRVKKTIKDAECWKKEAEKMADQIHITIIRKYIDEAGDWIFSGSMVT